LKALIGQLAPAGDPAEDTASLTEAIERHPGSDLAVFPELFLGGYETEHPDRVALDSDGPELTRIGETCGRHGTALIVGFTERLANDRFANSAACFDRHGELSIYRKTHLFGEAESAAFQAGSELLVTGLAGIPTGPLICFDVEFPEPARMLALGGARLLVTIAANMRPYGPDHRVAARARALDNRLPHIYVNRTGSAGPIEFVGESCVIGPDGSVLAEFHGDEGIFETSFETSAGQAPETDYLKQLRNDLTISTRNVSSGGGA
jgi:predicted amidohydrolase